MKVTAISNCCSMGNAVSDAMFEAQKKDSPRGVEYNGTNGNPDPNAELVNVSALYAYGTGEATINKFVAELAEAEKSAHERYGNYVTGLIAVIAVQKGPMVDGFLRAGWLPVMNWPGGHGGTCTLWFKCIREHNGAKAVRRRNPETLPAWCLQEQKDGTAK